MHWSISRPDEAASIANTCGTQQHPIFPKFWVETTHKMIYGQIKYKLAELERQFPKHRDLKVDFCTHRWNNMNMKLYLDNLMVGSKV